MKRIWIASIAFIVVLGLCIYEIIFVNKAISSVQSKVAESIESLEVEDYETTNKLTDEIDELWKENNKKLALTISHIQLEDVDQSISVLNASIKAEEYSDFLAELYRINVKLDNIKDSGIPVISNIL